MAWAFLVDCEYCDKFAGSREFKILRSFQRPQYWDVGLSQFGTYHSRVVHSVGSHSETDFLPCKEAMGAAMEKKS